MNNEYVDIPNIEGYATIKEAAKMLGLSTRRVYEYVTEGRLPGVRAANAIMIPLEELRKFKRGASGRERKVTPLWRFSSGDNTQFITSIVAQIKPDQGKTLEKLLEDIKKHNKHLFPGTIARYFSSSEITPGKVSIILIWRGTVMPDDRTRREALEVFQHELADVLDWSTAQYDNSTVLMHT
jgi:excisionase family DNA binding protein